MTSLLSIGAGNHITIRTYKRLNANPSLGFANTYEAQANVDVVLEDYERLVSKLLTFEQNMLLTDVIFDRTVVSSYVEDGEPYNPTSFMVVNHEDAFGLVAPNGNPLPLNYVLNLKRKVPLGRVGKLQLRRALGEGDVDSPAGSARLTNPTVLNARLNGALVESSLAGYFVGGGEAFTFAMVSDTPTRLISALVVNGANIVKYNNRYFDIP